MKKSFNNIFVIVLINIFLFITFYYLINKYIDYDFYKKPQSFKSTTVNIDIRNEDTEPFEAKSLEYSAEIFKKYCGEKRIKFSGYNTDNPIAIIGCSYAYGHGLKREETFPYLLGKYTNHPVYNYAQCGTDAIDSFNNLIANAYKDNLNLQNTDYVIYIYMYDHINRYLEKYFLYGNLYNVFKLSDLERFICKNSLVRKLFVYYKLHKLVKDYPDTKEAEIYLKSVLNYMAEKVKMEMPNSKLIILIYDEKLPANKKESSIQFELNIMKSKIWNEFAKETGTTVIHTKDITGFIFNKDYKLNEDIAGWHPNAKAWAVLTPIFAKEYINN